LLKVDSIGQKKWAQKKMTANKKPDRR